MDGEREALPKAYRTEKEGFTFLLDRQNVEKLRTMADFETGREPALAEEFLRFRAETWAEALADAGAAPAEFSVEVDPHQRKVHLVRASKVVFSADI